MLQQHFCKGIPIVPWFVYIIECESGALYTGIATDIERRFEEHLAGRGARYFHLSPPRKVVYREEVASRAMALQRERAIKRLSRDRKRALVASQMEQ